MVTTWTVGDAEVVRILDVEVTLPPSLLLIGDTPEHQAATIAAAPWAVPRWATDANEVVFAFTAIGIRSGGTRIVVDPALGFDEGRDFPDAADRLAAFEAALAAAGFAPDAVDVVVNTHAEGIGWNARLDGTPLFPKARYLWPAADGAPPVAFAADDVTPPYDVTGEVTLDAAPGHTPGAMLVRVRSGGAELVVVGDLFIHPLQLADVGWVGNDVLPDETVALRRSLLADCAARGVPIVSPHFGAPGGGVVRADGEGRWALV